MQKAKKKQNQELIIRDVTQGQHYFRQWAKKNSSMGVASLTDFLTKNQTKSL